MLITTVTSGKKVVRSKPAPKRLYVLVVVGDRRILVSNASASILHVLSEVKRELHTHDLIKLSNVERGSITKLLQRLRSARIIETQRVGGVGAYHKLRQDVELHYDVEVAY